MTRSTRTATKPLDGDARSMLLVVYHVGDYVAQKIPTALSVLDPEGAGVNCDRD